MVTFPRDGWESMLAGLINGCVWYCHLYTNDPAIDDEVTVADFVPPVYTGYSPAPLTLWTPPTLRGPSAFSVHDPLEFRWPGGDVPLPIRGYVVTHGEGASVAWVRRRPGPAFPLGPASPLLILYLRLDFPPVG